MIATLLACQAAPPLPAAPPPLDPQQAFADAFAIEVIRWETADDRGRLWLVGAARATASLSVRPSEHVAPFAELLPTDDGPWVAINGGFYDQDLPMGLVVAGGEERAPLRPGGGSGVIAAGPDGLRIVHRDAGAAGAREALQSIDRLVDGGRNLVTARDGAPRAARSAVALAPDRVWFAVAASDESAVEGPDGVRLRATSGRGPDLHTFAALLIEHAGAEQALNLDGAVSTQLALRVGERRFAIEGELGTINALVLRP